MQKTPIQKAPLFQIDAFTTEIFRGNPAAVVIIPEFLSDEALLAIAQENNLSETAFVVPGGESDLFKLRWFTPTVEVDLCGHATLASAHVLFEHGLVSGTRVRFKSLTDMLEVTRDGELLTLNFPARPPEPLPMDEMPGIAEALGAQPAELLGSRDVVAVFEREDQVKELHPNLRAVAELDTFAVCVTAPGTNGTDFVSRFFAPGRGVPEDPVTGSAHCTLAPYWADQLGKDELVARQLSERGGELRCQVKAERVFIAGHAVEYMVGEIAIPTP